MTFAQVGSPVHGVDGILFDSITCFGCRQKGHYKSKCPAPESPDIQMLQIDDDFVDTDPPDSTHESHPPNPEEVNNDPADENEGGGDPDEEGDVFHSFGFLQEGSIQSQQPATIFPDLSHEKSPRMIDENFILLDSESTVCTFHNRSLLKNVRVHSGGKSAKVHTNGGTQTSYLVADYTKLDIPVWQTTSHWPTFYHSRLIKCWPVTRRLAIRVCQVRCNPPLGRMFVFLR